MAVRKEIIVLNGGGHKGVVKISDVKGKSDYAKISCSLDFRPTGAFLYLIGDNIAKVALKDVNQEVEVPFRASDDIGCVVRSSSLTMFGGRGVKSEMLARIDSYNRRERVGTGLGGGEEIEPVGRNAASRTPDVAMPSAYSASKAIVETVVPNDKVDGINCEQDEVNVKNSDSIENRQKQFVGVAVQSDVNPLGEWTKYDGNNFYYAVKPQIDEMFVCYPEEKLLCDTVPNSKWVHVDAEDGYYVVGLLYDEDRPSYICYGVPQYPTADGSARRAPAELENMCVWLPVPDTAEMEGYWMIYQSAYTGEIIK